MPYPYHTSINGMNAISLFLGEWSEAMTTFSGLDGMKTYRALAVKHGLKLYVETGIKPNRDWTPTAMLRVAGNITGKVYKHKQVAEAISDLEAWIKANGTLGEWRME